MFELDQAQSWVDTLPEDVAFIATSVNRPAVAPPDRSPEPAQAYITTLRRDNLFEVYIYLHLVSSNVGLLYRWDAGAIPREMVTTLQQNALEFTETMGFMMTDLRYRQMSPEDKQSVFESTPVFHQDLSRFKTEEEEVQELEPEEVGETELVIEPIEEPGVEMVTEGDFVLEGEPETSLDTAGASEVAPVASALEGEQVDEIFLEGVEESPGQVDASAGTSEEDMLLDNLEVKAEKASPVSAPPPSPASAVEDIKSKGEELLDALEAQDEGIAGSNVIQQAAYEAEEPSIEAEAPLGEETEEITIEGLIEEDSGVEAQAVEEQVAEAYPEEEATQEMEIPPGAIMAEDPSPSLGMTSPVKAGTIQSLASPSPPGPIAEDMVSQEEDIKVLIQLLTMM
jgi:hypothetical protein